MGGDHGLSAQDKTDIGNLSGTNTGDVCTTNHTAAGYSTATGVENNADVTDAANVKSALGGAMGSNTLQIGDGSTVTTFPGDIVVTGDTTYHNETVRVIANNTLQFEGATNDGYETDLTVIDPTADRTISLPNASGTVALATDITGTNSGTNTGDETKARINALDITELGTISSGVWQGSAINTTYLDGQSGTNTGDTSVTDSTSTTSSTTRASATAVKAAYDRASTGITDAAAAAQTANSAVKPTDTFYIGTTQIAHNRGSGTDFSLAGITLDGPNIGTPSAGTLTNCSDLPAANISQGTMASGMVLVAPALGTPASGVATNLTGTAASLTAGTATVATTVTITDNENTNETNAIIFTSGGDVDGGNIGLESDGHLTYNPATSLLTVGFLAPTVGRKLELPSNSTADYRGADIVYFGTGDLTSGTIYYYGSDGEGGGTWISADADAEATAKGMLAVALGASPADGMLLKGMVTLDHDPGAVGDVLYLSTTAGDATSGAPADNGAIIRIIGYCLAETDGMIYFDPDKTFVEVTA